MKRGFSVLLFDYRGYGLSSGATVDEADLYLDGEAAWDFIANEKKAAPETVVLYGSRWERRSPPKRRRVIDRPR